MLESLVRFSGFRAFGLFGFRAFASVHEISGDFSRNQPSLERVAKEPVERRAAAGPIVERELIDVHPDELIGVP